MNGYEVLHVQFQTAVSLTGIGTLFASDHAPFGTGSIGSLNTFLFSLDGSTFNPVTFGAANDGPSAFSKDFYFKEDGCTPDRSPAWPADCRAQSPRHRCRQIAQFDKIKTTARSILSLRICVRLPKALVTVRRTPITAGSRCAFAQGTRCSLVSSDGRCLSDREPLRRMLRSEPFP